MTAVLDAAGEKTLSFIPAFPKMGRITKNGIHYIDGIPVEKSAFGKDPYEPVTCSYVPDIIKLQSKAEVKRAAEEDSPFENQNDPGIIVWDAESDKQLKSLGERLYKGDKLHIMAGCAGFASVLPQLLGLEGNLPSIPSLYQRFFVVCGSVNPITVSQMDYAENHNFYRIRMSTIEKLKDKYWQSDVGQKKLDYLKDLIETKSSSILDSNDLPGSNSTKEYAARHNISSEQIRVCIAKNIGCFVKELIRKGFKGTIMITGGDTLIGCMEQMEVYEMEPICELAPGIVLSRFISQDTAYHVISKSGGFGGEKLLTELAEQILTYKWN
ncbi:four-carbon acid sugar kinase family protein [Anaerocolumna sedimenticola]|uniref:four-carbon acid sugar kinase family protein n=1 Tax=Anaerocolumna sedimenticola TaxID=2696063 RepID=UPI002484217E|nr:four-carbon acid sugar kinase family protein [Anaerocolumna sedimenticola]